MQSSTNPLDDSFARLARETLERWRVPGVSIAVVDGDSTWAEGYGIATFPSEPATASTLYEAGSTTKAFTAAAVSLLVDDGKLKFDTPISAIVGDDFVLQDEADTNRVTVEDALSHRTGLPRHEHSYGGIYAVTAQEVTRSLRHLPRVSALRTRYIYCNIMYIVVAHVIETLSKSTIGDFFQKRILEPLEMASTYTTLPAARAAKEHLAQGYYHDAAANEYRAVPNSERGCLGPGGLISNVLDYSKWVRMMIERAAPISQAGHDALRTPYITIPAPSSPLPFTGPVQYCLGWETAVYHGRRLFMHTGGVLAYGAMVIWMPSENFGLVGFANTAITSRYVLDALLWHLIDEKLAVPSAQRYDWNTRNAAKVQEQAVERENTLQDALVQVDDSKPLHVRPLTSYVGTYSHPAYQNMDIVSVDGRLQILRTEGQWKICIDLDHHSGEHFVARMKSVDNPGTDLFVGSAVWPAEFRIGPDGIPESFGAGIEKDLGEEKILFHRISSP